MTSIAYTNLRKEPGMDVLPRWVELVRSDKKRAAFIDVSELRSMLLHRKLSDPERWDWAISRAVQIKGFRPFERRRHVMQPGDRDRIPF